MGRVLIVIVVYNGIGYLKECLSSLSGATYPKQRFEILVVDNASTDGSAAYVREHWVEVKLLENQANVGFAAANNIGMQLGIDRGFDYVYLLNQDTAVAPDFLDEAVRVARADQQIGAVQSKLLLYHDQGNINSIGNEIHYLGFAFAGGYRRPDAPMKVTEITYPSGASVLLRASALKDIGLFNPDFFMYHEDVDLGWRLWLGGYRVVLAPASVVYHKYEFSKSIKKFYYMERNRRLVMLQNYKLGTLLLIAPAYLVMSLALFIYSCFAGWGGQSLRILGYFLSVKNWRKIIATRRRVQKSRRLGDGEIVKRFVGKIEFQDLQNPLLRSVANPIFNAYWQVAKRLIWW